MFGLILLSVYLLSIISFWFWIHLAYSKGGIWEDSQYDTSFVTILFLPLINTVMGVFAWFIDYPIKRKKKKINFEKFFLIKKID
jgi:hypothetical protein